MRTVTAAEVSDALPWSEESEDPPPVSLEQPATGLTAARMISSWFCKTLEARAMARPCWAMSRVVAAAGGGLDTLAATVGRL